ncbi:alanine racemase [Nocardioides pakistanensis]
MSVTLYVDGDSWRGHLRRVLEAHPSLVPVIKGNGYGFGNARLARKSAWLGVDTVAVGTYAEVEDVRTRFDGTILVLTPWRPFEERVEYDDRIVHTVGRLEDLHALAARDDRPRVVLELMTSMRRHGFTARGLREAAPHTGSLRVEGVALHLPMAHGSHLPEMERLMTDVVAAGLPTNRVWVSHLTDAELSTLAATYPDFELRPRVGTNLWLGDRGALAVRATVLDAHPVERGDVFGYRARSAPKAGTILVVSGGTAHGIGLEAPSAVEGLRQRAVTLAKGGLEASGFVRSPFTIGGKQRLFAEPPHMQASMLFLPHGAPVPEVGAEVDVRVRFTTTTFDRTVVS